MTHNLTALSQSNDFLRPHIGPDDEQANAMLSALGVSSLDELIQQTVPAAILRGDTHMNKNHIMYSTVSSHYT